MSEDEFVNVRPFNANKKTNNDIDEASDTYDTIDWLVKNIPIIMERLVFMEFRTRVLFNHGSSKQSSGLESRKPAGACDKLVYR